MGNLSFLNQNVSFQDVPEGGDFTPFVEGEYGFMVTDVEVKQTSGNGTMIATTSKVITEGPYLGRAVKHNFNIVNNNETTVKIAYQQLKQLSLAVGLQTFPDDTNDLVNKVFVGKVKLRQPKEATYIDTNGVQRESKPQAEIVDFKPSNKVAIGTGQTTSTPTQLNAAGSAAPKLPWQK